MEARRILLFFGIVLLLTAAAASFVPVPTEPPRDATETSPENGREGSPETEQAPDDATAIRFDVGEEPRSESAEPNAQAVVTVAAPEPGEVELEGLGQIENVEPRTPAVFDLFTDRTGRFEVVFTPVEGEKRRVGTIVVER